MPASRFKLVDVLLEALNAVDEDRLVALEVIREDDRWPLGGQLDHGDPAAHRLDRKDEASTKDVTKVAHVGDHVASRCVDVVEAVEWWRHDSMSPLMWGLLDHRSSLLRLSRRTDTIHSHPF